MNDIVLSVEQRERVGKGGAREARRQHRVPGVIYGGPLGSVPISLELKQLNMAFTSGSLLSKVIEIDHRGEKQPVLIRDIAFDPVTDFPIHIDLYRVDVDQIVSVEVPVKFINEENSPGLKRGGALNVVRHLVELDCPAGRIPANLTFDLTGLDIGDSVHISAIELPEGVTPAIKDRDFTVATITGSGAKSEEDAAEQAAVAPVEESEEAEGEEKEKEEE